MGILKDFNEDNDYVVWYRKVIYFFSPSVWLRLHKWRKQRADRGWSDRDTWGAGDHIAKITAAMLQHLNDYTYTDWPEWFKLNVQENGRSVYTDLQSVIDDINKYMYYSENTSWTDGLESSPDPEATFGLSWYDKSANKITDAQITKRITSHRKKEIALYKNATKAMQFFGRHFNEFWD